MIIKWNGLNMQNAMVGFLNTLTDEDSDYRFFHCSSLVVHSQDSGGYV